MTTPEPLAHQADQRERWTVCAALWSAHPPAYDATTRLSSELMLAALNIQPNLRVHDVACGPGEPAITIEVLDAVRAEEARGTDATTTEGMGVRILTSGGGTLAAEA
jgi:hypothetical protein